MKKKITVLILAILASGAVAYNLAYADIYGSSLVAWYTLDSNDISGTTVTDNSGSGNTGTTVNSPTSAIGKMGQALSFNGTGQYVSISNPSSFSIPTISVSVWYKPSLTLGSGLVSNVFTGFASGGGNTLEVDFNSFSTGGFEFYYRGNYSTTCGAVQPANAYTTNAQLQTWHHIVGVYNLSSSLIQLYVDGVLVGSGSCTSQTLTGLTAVQIGSSDSTTYLYGGADDVRVYNRALSAGEVQQLYYQGISQHSSSGF